MARPKKSELYFDPDRADRVQKFFEKVLVHTKGRFARQPFILADWQRDEIIRPLFGTVRFDRQLDAYVRAFTTAWIELARKNGKSELVAGCGLYLLTADDEEGAEIYGCAKDRDQASAVYNVAKRMVELSRALSARLEVIDSKKRIIDRRTGSYYQVIAADGAGNLGHNPHGVLFDEVITQPSRELWDALKTGMGTRDQPLMIAATTAGTDSSLMAAEEHAYSESVQANPSLDPSRFVFMRNTDKDADWRDEASWTHANPALGDFLRIQVLRDEAVEAAKSPSKQNAFRQFRLNQWVRQTTRWFDLAAWDRAMGMVTTDEFNKSVAYGGLDLSSTTDFTAAVILAPSDSGYIGRCLVWIPEERAEQLIHLTSMPLHQWRKEGFLIYTEGNVVDYERVRRDFTNEVKSLKCTIAEIAYDPWNAAETVQAMETEGYTMVPLRQGYASLSNPSKELERLIVGSTPEQPLVRFGWNPVLRWMADCVETMQDPSGNIKPTKPDRRKSAKRIDGIAALVNALARAMLHAPPKRKRRGGFG